jgi:hypothetical protein
MDVLFNIDTKSTYYDNEYNFIYIELYKININSLSLKIIQEAQIYDKKYTKMINMFTKKNIIIKY